MTSLSVAMMRCKKTRFDEDASGRIDMFGTAVTQSVAMMKHVPADLHMVVAPEYFFSPIDEIGQRYKQDGPTAMTRGAKHDLYGELEKVSKKAGNTILVAGSIYYKKGKKNVRGLNVCPVLCQGKFLHKYYKKFDDGALKKGIAGASYEHKKSDPVFEKDGVTFGIEVCGDHSDTNNNLASWLLAKPQTIDVHLMISDSNFPQAKYMTAKPGGYFIQCDLAGENQAALAVYQSGADGRWTTEGNSTLKPPLTPRIKFVSGGDVTVEVYHLTGI